MPVSAPPQSPQAPGLPVTSLPGSPKDGQQAILTDSTTTPTYSTLYQYSVAAGAWLALGPVTPPGVLSMYAAAAAPTGWLLCDGSAVSRSTYAALFAVIGVLYGAGNGTTTFNLPDMRGRVPAGYAAAGGHTDVSTLGLNDGVAAANRRAKHQHTPHTHVVSTGDRGSGGHGLKGGLDYNGPEDGAITQGFASADGGSGVTTDSTDAPAYLVVNFIVKT